MDILLINKWICRFSIAMKVWLLFQLCFIKRTQSDIKCSYIHIFVFSFCSLSRSFSLFFLSNIIAPIIVFLRLFYDIWIATWFEDQITYTHLIFITDSECACCAVCYFIYTVTLNWLRYLSYLDNRTGNFRVKGI